MRLDDSNKISLDYNFTYTSVESSPKSHVDDGEFDHIVAYALSCIEDDNVCRKECDSLIKFGSLDEVSIGVNWRGLDEDKNYGYGRISFGSFNEVNDNDGGLVWVDANNGVAKKICSIGLGKETQLRHEDQCCSCCKGSSSSRAKQDHSSNAARSNQ